MLAGTGKYPIPVPQSGQSRPLFTYSRSPKRNLFSDPIRPVLAESLSLPHHPLGQVDMAVALALGLIEAISPTDMPELLWCRPAFTLPHLTGDTLPWASYRYRYLKLSCRTLPYLSTLALLHAVLSASHV